MRAGEAATTRSAKATSASVSAMGSAAKRSGDEVDKAGKKHSRAASAIGGTARAATSLTGVLAGAGLFAAIKSVSGAWEEHVKVGRDTAQVLKTTGGAANVTQKQVESLAGAIAKKTAIDDDQIQAAGNLILTFTRVRNEVGRGNDIFNQANQAAVDLSARFNQDLTSSARQVGKALNDPVKGVSALQRVGVSFTAQQKEQIKTMVESGNVLGAQKVILAELRREAGGAAAARATDIDRLKQSFGELQEAIGGVLAPALAAGARGLTQFFDEARAGTGAGGEVVAVLHGMGTAIGTTAGLVGDLVNAAGGLGTVVPLLAGAAAGFAAFKVAAGAAVAVRALTTAMAAVEGASGLAAIAPALAAMVTPAGLVAAAFIATGAAVAYAASQESAETIVGKMNAAGKRDQAAAVKALADAELAAADATQGAERADLAHQEALKTLTRLKKEGKQGTKEYAEAERQVRETGLQAINAHKREADALKERTKDEQKAIEAAQKRIKLTRAAQILATMRGDEKARAQADRDHAQAVGQLDAAMRRAAISQLNYMRLTQGLPALHGAAATAASNLGRVFRLLPKNVQTRIAVSSPGALATIGNLIGRLGKIPPRTIANILTNAKTSAVQIAALTAVARGVPPQRVLKILHNGKPAKDQIDALDRSVRGLRGKSLSIKTTAPNAKRGVDALAGGIGRLHGKTVSVNLQDNITGALSAIQDAINSLTGKTVPVGRQARGRAAGDGELSVVGEGGGPEYVVDASTGAGYRTRGAMVTALGPDDYVIPTEGRYRGRAMGLIRSLLADMGVSAFAGGRYPHVAPARRTPAGEIPGVWYGGPNAPHPTREELATLNGSNALSHQLGRAWGLQVISGGRTATQDQRLGLATSPHQVVFHGNAGAYDLGLPVGVQRKMKGPARARYMAKLRGAAAYAQQHYGANTLIHAAEGMGTHLHVAFLQSGLGSGDQAQRGAEASLGQAETGDPRGRLTWVQGRLTTIRGRVAFLRRALNGRLTNAQRGAFRQELHDLTDEQTTLTGERDSLIEETGGLSQQQSDWVAAIESQEALAALTPGLGDDQFWAGQMVNARESILQGLQASGAPNSSITAAAQAVKSARDDLTALTGGGGDVTADQQAQLDQMTARAVTAETQARRDAAALGAFQGSGDIGYGRPYVVVNTLHPGDPQTLGAIAEAAWGGTGLQGNVSSPRERSGV